MTDIPLIGSRPIEGPIIRLLFCLVCTTIEELPPHEGPAATDTLLELAAEKHEFPSGDRHVGKLFLLPVKAWMDPTQRKAIIDQLKQGAGLPGSSEGLDALSDDKDYYTSKSQFGEDAMACWKQHISPKDGCNDYMSESKRLVPKTEKARLELGLPSSKESGISVHLCQFCPVHSVMMTKHRAMRGMY
jgi:hypothetical protein